jgi:hypothetical protein
MSAAPTAWPAIGLRDEKGFQGDEGLRNVGSSLGIVATDCPTDDGDRGYLRNAILRGRIDAAPGFETLIAPGL